MRKKNEKSLFTYYSYSCLKNSGLIRILLGNEEKFRIKDFFAISTTITLHEITTEKQFSREFFT